MFTSLIITILISLFALLLASYVLGFIIWKLNPLFFLMNWLLWVAYNPIRFFWKGKNSAFPYASFRFFQFTLLLPLYWILVHALTTPLRFINALYFDVLLYWSVMLKDSLEELFNPKIGTYRDQRGARYIWHWLYALPYRFLWFAWKSLMSILDSALMLGISIVFPTFTLFHGTNFREALTDITQKGTWIVGRGNFAGTGIYFGIRKRVASHYADSSDKGIIVARVTPTFTRNLATLPKAQRQQVGEFSERLTQEIPRFWSTAEHWREDFNGWWEYCLLQRKGIGTQVKTWRIRPVVLLRVNPQGKDKPHRLWGGMSHYCYMPSAWFFGILSWFIIGAFLADT